MMQYRNLNLDKLQAFAPERKLIDKENIYNAFLGLGDTLQKGADAYTLSKIYQLSPEEQQRKMAEYRAYKGDFSGFDNIEQTKLRQAEMNALKEQQRVDKEEEEDERERVKSVNYWGIQSNKNVIMSELLKQMREYNSQNANSEYTDLSDKKTRLKFMQDQAPDLLSKLSAELVQEKMLNFKPKFSSESELDFLDKVAPEIKEKSKESRSFVVDKNFSFDADRAKEEYIFNDKWEVSKDGLTDTQKKTLKDYVLTKFVNFNGRIISDDLTKNEKEKLSDIGLSFITKAEVNASRERAKSTADTAKAKSLAGQQMKASGFGEPMKDESFNEFLSRLEKSNLTTRDQRKLNEILKNYGLR